MYSVYQKDLALSRRLLQSGANPECSSYCKEITRSLLSYAAIVQKSPEMVHVLLQHGANPNQKTGLWHSLLAKVLLKPRNNNQIALHLIEFGAKPEQLISHGKWAGWSVLAYAMFLGEVAIAKALLAKGANPHYKICSGYWKNLSLIEYFSLELPPPLSWLMRGSKEVREELRRITLVAIEDRARQHERQDAQTASSYQIILGQNSQLLEQLQQEIQQLRSELIIQRSQPAAMPMPIPTETAAATSAPLRQPGPNGLFARSAVRQMRSALPPTSDQQEQQMVLN